MAVSAPGTTSLMSIPDMQSAIRAEGLDGWLLYDFRGLNAIAADLTAINRQGGHLATRRWYYLIPASGDPRKLVHAIERDSLSHLPGTTIRYSDRGGLEAGLEQLLSGMKRVAMEYSPECAIPYVSRVDGGTIELVRRMGVDVRSSGDLVQQFTTVWDPSTVEGHRAAADKLYRVKDRAFETIAHRLQEGLSTTEYDLQQLMVTWFGSEGLVADAEPNVSVGPNSGNPHYQPTATAHRTIAKDQIVLLDLWGKLDSPGAVFADITWMAYTGREVPRRYADAFSAVCRARDRAVALIEERVSSGSEVRGWEVDRAASSVLKDAGYGHAILHRTGHSLGEQVHGNGVNMDDYETHDDRRLLPGSGFTIEPGLYFEDFGVRSEINMIIASRSAEVTGPRQREILSLL